MIEVISTGFYTTIQDLGRFGYASYGVPISGAMDRTAFKLANGLLNNDTNCAALEITLTGPKLKFHCNSTICITGATIDVRIDGLPVSTYKPLQLSEGSILEFGKIQFGFRAYLAVKGGIQTDLVLGSRSQFKSITGASTISKKVILPIKEYSDLAIAAGARIHQEDSVDTDTALNCFAGPEFMLLPLPLQQKLCKTEFCISKNFSRMGYQLEEIISNELSPIITSPVLPGTVQLTPQGKLIVLMRDCQTTGGYPRVLQLTEHSLNLLAQKKIGDRINFNLNLNDFE